MERFGRAISIGHKRSKQPRRFRQKSDEILGISPYLKDEVKESLPVAGFSFMLWGPGRIIRYRRPESTHNI